jgi:hypothetical protein
MQILERVLGLGRWKDCPGNSDQHSGGLSGLLSSSQSLICITPGTSLTRVMERQGPKNGDNLFSVLAHHTPVLWYPRPAAREDEY